MRLQHLVHDTLRVTANVTLFMLLVLGLAISSSGCSVGGGGSGGGDDDGTLPPANAVDPFLADVEPNEGAPGDVVTLEGFNFPLDIDAHQVTFTDSSGADVTIRAQILSITATGEFVAGFGDRTLMEVVVPNNVRTGFVNLISTTDRDVFFAGARGFTGAPQIVAVALGTTGRLSRVALDEITLSPSPDTVEFVGYNLQTVDTCLVLSADGDSLIESPEVVPFFPESPVNDATWELLDGMSAVSVEIPTVPGVLGVPSSQCEDGDTHPYQFNLSAIMPSDDVITLPPIDVQFRGPFAEIVPATVTGVVLPSGTRGGIVPITYALFEQPASSRWDVFPEFESPPGSGVWIECAGAMGSSEGRDVIPGGTGSSPNIAALLGRGMRNTFYWDTTDFAGGLPDGRNVARLRIRAIDPEEGENFLPCDSGTWETGPIVIDNSVPEDGLVVETFQADFQEDEDLSDARWDTSGGVILGVTGSDSYFGTGTADILLEDGETYSFLTDTGEASKDGVDAEDLFITDTNPGAPFSEFWVASFIMEEGATVNVIGDAPLVIRVSNPDGEDGVVAAIDGVIDLSGGHGARPVTAGEVGGVGGEGGPGGGDGGDGGVVMADGGNSPGAVTDQIQPTGGEFGAEAGSNIDIVKPSGSLNNPRPGAGGGGGHARRGEDGNAQGGSSMVAPSGRGSGPRGDSEMTIITGGDGGGGGAGFPFRSSAQGALNGRAGGGAGGGGGAMLLAVDGQLRVLGQIICDGGLGATGDSGGPPGPGGGGAGGGIKLQATLGIEMGEDTLLRAMGGEGGAVGSSGNVQGGTGSPGRIRLESNGPIGLPGLVNFDNVEGPEEGQFYGRLTDGVDGGSGFDGNLDLTGVEGVVVIDTDTGELFLPGDDEPLLDSAGGAGEFHWSGLDVPEDVTIRAFGDNPLIFRVLGECIIAGTIDVSGEDGGQVAGEVPGAGGRGGAGGGAGGAGGFADVDGVTHGEPGGFPAEIAEENQGGLPPFGELDPPSDDPFEPFEVLPPSGGESVNDCSGCTAGHGAGGGYLERGESGAPGKDGESGDGGFDFGTQTLQNPDDASPLRSGGTGGSGGGGSYSTDTETSVPGSGAGGAGGYFQLSVEGAVKVAATARLLADGGDAFQAPVGGGNAGAGAGGAILIEGSGVVQFQENELGEGPEVSALGGTANLEPDAGNGNGEDGGGDGSPGRIAIRSVIEFNLGDAPESDETYDDEDDLPTTGIHPEQTIGAFVEADTVRAQTITLPYDVVRFGGVKDGAGRFGDADIALEPPVLFPGTFVRTLYSGAAESLDDAGKPGPWTGPVTDLSELDGSEFLRIHFYLYSTRILSPGYDEISIPVDFEPEEEP